MKEQKWNRGWKFWSDQGAFALVWNIPEDAREVDLPHDAMLEVSPRADSPNGGNTGYRDGGVYTYAKTLYAPEEYRDRTLMLKFEGVYMNAMVYVNEQLAAKCPYGYTGFYVNLNEHLRYGQDNEIRVLVKNSGMANSRWYSGSGIYRDVYLLDSDTVYLEPEGVRIDTESLDEELAVITVSSAIKNRRYQTVPLRLETRIEDPAGETAAEEYTTLSICEGGTCRAAQRVAVERPFAWSEDSPSLYRCISRLYEGETLVDTSETIFGIRTLTLDAIRGLRVNGQTVKLRGACVHHDSGLLGAATYEAAQYRQVKRLKEAGFNAIRISHQPAAPAMLRACDALGVYVMDEAFDMWTRSKSDNDYALFFDRWWETDVEAMVRKDYNHPSVIFYSVGNEIPEIGTDQGAALCGQICEKVRSMDRRRFTLASVNGIFSAGDKIGQIMADLKEELADAGEVDEGANVNDFMSVMDTHLDQIVTHPAITERLEKACASTDIAGYNYMTARYEPDGKAYPNRVIVGSETYPPEIARNWGLIRRLPYVIGDFTWTGWDYIGEAGVGVVAYAPGEGGLGAQFPIQLAYCGDIDLTGFRRPNSYFREVVFGLRRDPYITVQNPYRYGQEETHSVWVISDNHSSWTYPGCEGKPAVVEVYAPGDEVELFLNGKSLGLQPAGASVGFRTLFEVAYQPGILQAVAYENGRKIGSMDLKTAAAAEKLQLDAEEVTAGGETLVYVEITAADDNGIPYDAEELTLQAEAAGDAKILGFGSGDPKPVYPYLTDTTRTFYGKALLILKRTGKEAADVTVRAEGLEPALLRLGAD